MGALLGFMLGYVLGAKAGPESYDELRKAWETIVNSEEFKSLLGVGTTFVQGMLQQGQQSLGDTLSGLTSGNGDLGDALKKLSGNGQLMDAWNIVSQSPELQSLLATGVSFVGGAFERGRAAMREAAN